mmetsp:Transcript_5139/g.9465  ORF Transcript_5139/g.9465 Transcript_5139/m.9465 type:complete len:343 (-) Transcript_5139:282-1310(-)
MQVQKTELERNKYLVKMRKGSILFKIHSRTGLPEKRWFIVSDDGSSLMWTKTSTNMFGIKTKKKRNLADALYLTYGKPETASHGLSSWLCFSIVFCEKSGSGKTWITKAINIGCENQQQLETWFFGIQSLIPLHHQHKSQAYVRWERAMMKVECIAELNKQKPAKVWQKLFEDAIRHVKGSNNKFMLRKLVHMNLARLAREARKQSESEATESPKDRIKALSLDSKRNPINSTSYVRDGRSPRRVSPLATPGAKNEAMHDLTEKMIHRKPYIEKKIHSRQGSYSRSGSMLQTMEKNSAVSLYGENSISTSESKAKSLQNRNSMSNIGTIRLSQRNNSESRIN